VEVKAFYKYMQSMTNSSPVLSFFPFHLRITFLETGDFPMELAVSRCCLHIVPECFIYRWKGKACIKTKFYLFQTISLSLGYRWRPLVCQHFKATPPLPASPVLS